MTPVLRSLPETELIDWLRLIRTDTIGPRTFFGLLARYGTVRNALEALPHLKGGRVLKIASRQDAEAELEAARRSKVRLVALCEPAYPPSLRAIDSAPPLLAVQGALEVLQRPMVAIVGSRNASGAGLVMTERLARGIGEAGHVIVSGLARGIDAKAHLASLETGTIAVLAGGHQRIYPSEHAGLAARIAERGAVLSEMPLAWEPRGRDFPRRNRIVSGLSLGVVVIEAARRSGSLITARFANEQGREVFAVPGSPLDPRAEGTNDLLRQGATFCTGTDDVVEALKPMMAGGRPAVTFRDAAVGEIYWEEVDLDLVPELPSMGTKAASTPRAGRGPGEDPPDEPVAPVEGDLRAHIVELIGPTPVSIDDLVRLAAAPVRDVQAVLIELELDGLLDRHGAGLVARAKAG